MNKYDNLIIEFSGYLNVSPNSVRFQYVGTDKRFQPVINGNKYVKLTEKEKSEYILESVAKTMEVAEDVDFDEIKVMTRDD
jgi:hypothetical protein